MISRIARAAFNYRLTHFGLGGKKGVMRASIAHGKTFTVLGELVSLVYRTRKFGDGGEQNYEHVFARSRPLLVYNRTGLAIARGRSKYRVGIRGILR